MLTEEVMVRLHMEQKEAFPLAVVDGIKMLQTVKRNFPPCGGGNGVDPGGTEESYHRVIMHNIETKATSQLISFGHLSFECLLVVCTAAVGSK